MALYEGNVSWAKHSEGGWQMVARAAGSWNASNVSDMLKMLAATLKADDTIKAYTFWLDVGLPDSPPKDMKLKELLAYAKVADRVELVACRVKTKAGRSFMAPKLKITKGGSKGGKASTTVYL
jgi:hypothetical protein